jgi:hypothetical protein
MKITNKWVVLVGAAVITVSIAGAAFAASGSSSPDSTAGTVATAAPATTATPATTSTQTSTTPEKDWSKQGNGETALTGDTLTQVQTAALAAAGTGSTLVRATTETDNSDAAIKYEAFVKKSDGTTVKMYLDASFNVVSTENASQGGSHFRGPGKEGASGTGSTNTTSGSM